jgi:hypothetical protein
MAAPRFRALALGGPVVVVSVLLILRRFLDYIESRPGPVLADPILPLVRPHDVALVVFSTMYLALLVGIVALARRPDRLVAGLWAYAAMLVLRMVAMYLVPLDPPPALVPLRDPFVELFGQQRTLTRDLFFSGHTATLFLLALTIPTRGARIGALAATFIVAAGVMIHHAHYAVDVLVAPFVAYACHRAGRWLVDASRPAQAC